MPVRLEAWTTSFHPQTGQERLAVHMGFLRTSLDEQVHDSFARSAIIQAIASKPEPAFRPRFSGLGVFGLRLSLQTLVVESMARTLSAPGIVPDTFSAKVHSDPGFYLVHLLGIGHAQLVLQDLIGRTGLVAALSLTSIVTVAHADASFANDLVPTYLQEFAPSGEAMKATLQATTSKMPVPSPVSRNCPWHLLALFRFSVNVTSARLLLRAVKTKIEFVLVHTNPLFCAIYDVAEV
jgi:hypothetical protein